MTSRFFKWIGISLAVGIVALLCGTAVRAQETADIVGTVTDTSGAVIPGATITLTNIGTNIQQSTQSNGTGDYVFNLLQVGTYSIKVESKGFKTFVAPNVTLAAGDRARADAKLEVGDVSQTVEVSGTVAPALQTDTSSIGSLVPSQSVEDLPLDSRNIVRLVQLTAGATEGSPSSIAEGARPDDRRLTSAISMNGQGDSENTNLVDGFDNNERIIGFLGARPSIDAIQEVNVTSNKYDASVGRTGGAVIDVITKSGTNSFHGSAFEFLRNKVLNTNPNFNFTLANNPPGAAAPYNLCPTAAACPAAPNPAFRQNQYGGSLGGPILKNKTFFFVDYEGFAQGIGLAAALFNVPTYCEKGLGNSSSPFAKPCPDGGTAPGDFSDLNPVSNVGGSNGQNTAAQGANLSSLPLCTSSSTPGTCLSPLGLAVFNMYPLPNTGGPGAITNNYTSAPVRTQNSKTYDARVDQHFSDKNSFWAHITYNGETTITPNGFPDVYINPLTGASVSATTSGAVKVEPVVTSYAGPNNEDQYSFGSSFVHVFSSNLLLNLKFGIFRSQILSYPANQGTEVANKLGFPCTATACINYTTGASLVGSSGLSHFSISGLNGAGGYTTIGDSNYVPIGYWDTGFQYMAQLTWNRGNHSIRYGLGLIRRRAGVAQSNAAQGQFNFNGSYTGVAMGDVLEGLSSGMSRNNSLVQQGFRTWEPSGYVQDDWRARPWLTLNIGLRYDIFTPYTEVHGRISNYDPYTGLIVSPSLPGQNQSNSTAMVTTPYNDYAPRFGFAATLKHDMVLRGGFGLTFFPTNYRSDYYFLNAPFNYAVSCGIQNQVATNNSCLTAQYDGPAGQFTNTMAATYGTASSQSGSTVAAPGTVCSAGTATGTTAGCGGALFSAGLPVPVLNAALATNTANYPGTSMIPVPINQQESYLEQFNLGIQKQFGANVIDIGYVGELGRHAEVNGAPENQPTNPTLASTPPLTLGGNTPLGVLPGFAYMKTVGMTVANNWGTSAYEGLQTSFVRRFNAGLTVNVNYTWSHMMSNLDSNTCVSSYFATPTPCFIDTSNGVSNASPKLFYGFEKYAWGNDSLDVTHRVTWGINYDIPLGKSFNGITKTLLAGWGLNTSGGWQTGLPFTPSASINLSGLSVGQQLDQIGSGKLSNPTLHQWFNYNDFVQPATGTIGDQHINQLFGPHQTRFDASLFKDFALNERFKLQFRAEIFNLLNQVNFNTPNASIAFTGTNSAGVGNTVPPVNLTGSHVSTGEITSTNATWNQREVQFALKLLF